MQVAQACTKSPGIHWGVTDPAAQHKHQGLRLLIIRTVSLTTPVKSHLLLAEKEHACVIFLRLIYPERCSCSPEQKR